jgi:hypothetical protein
LRTTTPEMPLEPSSPRSLIAYCAPLGLVTVIAKPLRSIVTSDTMTSIDAPMLPCVWRRLPVR